MSNYCRDVLIKIYNLRIFSFYSGSRLACETVSREPLEETNRGVLGGKGSGAAFFFWTAPGSAYQVPACRGGAIGEVSPLSLKTYSEP